MRDGDWLLAFWLLTTVTLDLFVFGGTAYLVFWRGFSGWWFVLASMIAYQPTLYKVLCKRFGVKSDA